MIDALTQVGYLVAAVAFLLLAIAVATIWRRRYRGIALFSASLLTAVWCALLAYASGPSEVPLMTLFVVEVLTDFAWLVFVASLFHGAKFERGFMIVRYAGVFVAAGVLLVGGIEWLFDAPLKMGLSAVHINGSILTSIAGLIAIEQVFRNGRASQRRDLRYLCLGISSLFVVDLLLYSNAVFSGHISPLFWEARGFVLAMGAVLTAIAIRLRDVSAPGVFVSRRVVIHATAIIAAGIYLTVVGLAGQLVRIYGQDWGESAQVVMFFGAAIVLVVIVLSDSYRKKLRVFVAKHFFEAKYDYREEWQRLITILTSTDFELPLAKRAVCAVLGVVDSKSGVLWQARSESGQFVARCGWDLPVPEATISKDQALMAFIGRTHWVINLDELRSGSQKYEGLGKDSVPAVLDGIWALVPLVHQGIVCGIVALTQPTSLVALNFEDRDLLKMVGRQVASYLEQELATERLAESKQFEAFSKLTAFLMHDLKNTMAQQLLIVKNAEKHRRNPDFVDDVVESIKNSAERIRKVVNQLQQASKGRRHEIVDVGKIILIAASRSEARMPVPAVAQRDARVFVRGDEERLLMAFCHAIDNAQDATPTDGSISISFDVEGNECIVLIKDTGAGMEPAFMHERLFKPFDSTKGAQGMGIGAHQIRETLREIGGDVTVQSAPGEGTTMIMRMPIATKLS